MSLGMRASQVEDGVLRLKKTFGWSFFKLN
jgi:hypothetical protein